MKFIYRKQSGEVVMRMNGNGKSNEYDKNIFDEYSIDLTEEEKEKVNKNWILKIDSGKLILEKPNHVIQEEKTQNLEDLKQSIQNNKDNIKDLQKDLLKLIDIIK